MSNCKGKGECLDPNTCERKYKCKYNCKPGSCPKCNCQISEIFLDCNEGFCANCAVKLYSIYGQLELPHSNKNSESYYSFMKFMSDFYIKNNN